MNPFYILLLCMAMTHGAQATTSTIPNDTQVNSTESSPSGGVDTALEQERAYIDQTTTTVVDAVTNTVETLAQLISPDTTSPGSPFDTVTNQVSQGTTEAVSGIIQTVTGLGRSHEACWLDKHPRGIGQPPTECRSGEEKSGLLCYPACDPGWKGIGPVCWKGILRSKGRGVGRTMICHESLEEDAGLCYNKCESNEKGVLNWCYGSCPTSLPVQCGLSCVRDSASCTNIIASQTLTTASSVAAAAATANPLDALPGAISLVTRLSSWPQCSNVK